MSPTNGQARRIPPLGDELRDLGAQLHADARARRLRAVNDAGAVRILPAASHATAGRRGETVGRVLGAIVLALMVTVALFGVIVGALLAAYGEHAFGAACAVAALVCAWLATR